MIRNNRASESETSRRVEALSPAKNTLLAKQLRLMASKPSHQIIARSLFQRGIKHLYSVPGAPMYETLASCSAAGIRLVSARQQTHAVLMSLANNYADGRLASAAMFSPGPGVCSAATGILVAWDNKWPLLIVSGSRSMNLSNRGAFQRFDSVAFFRPISKLALRIDHADDLNDSFEHACSVAVSGTPGPVIVDIPEDVLTGKSREKWFDADHAVDSIPLAECDALDRCLHALSTCSRPLVIFGDENRWLRDDSLPRKFVDSTGIPFMTTQMARGLIPDNHDLCVNQAAQSAQQGADLVLLVNSPLDWTLRFGNTIKPNAFVIDIGTQSSAPPPKYEQWTRLKYDADTAIETILESVNTKMCSIKTDLEWIRSLTGERINRRNDIARRSAASCAPVTPYRLAAAVADIATDNMFCVLDGNVSMAVAEQVFRFNTQWQHLDLGKNGCIGAGIPFAIGAAISNPSRPVLVLCGDTGFGMSVMEVETAIRSDIKIVIVIANNDGISGASPQKLYFPPDHDPVTMFLPKLRYDQMVIALGGTGEYVEAPDDLEPALRRAFAADTVACVNVHVDPLCAHPGLWS